MAWNEKDFAELWHLIDVLYATDYEYFLQLLQKLENSAGVDAENRQEFISALEMARSLAQELAENGFFELHWTQKTEKALDLLFSLSDKFEKNPDPALRCVLWSLLRTMFGALAVFSGSEGDRYYAPDIFDPTSFNPDGRVPRFYRSLMRDFWKCVSELEARSKMKNLTFIEYKAEYDALVKTFNEYRASWARVQKIVSGPLYKDLVYKINSLWRNDIKK